MCTILITVSGGFLGEGWRPSIQNECFNTHYYSNLGLYCSSRE